MPTLVMRGRYLMREYWSDSDLFLRLKANEREMYQGLWMLADDAGWLPRDVPAIAAALYRYEDRTTRERFVTEGLAKLRDMGKLQSFRCCMYLPAVARYPRAGRQSNIFEVDHAKHQTSSKRSKDIQRDLNPSPVPSRPVPSLPVVAPEPAPAGAPGQGADTPSLKDRVGWRPEHAEVIA